MTGAQVVVPRLGHIFESTYTSAGHSVSVLSSWCWTAEDPLAVTLNLSDENGLASWVLSRDLVLAGLAGPVGRGGVILGPWPAPRGIKSLPEDGLTNDSDGSARRSLLDSLTGLQPTPRGVLLWLRSSEQASGLVLPWTQVRLFIRLSVDAFGFEDEQDVLNSNIDELIGPYS